MVAGFSRARLVVCAISINPVGIVIHGYSHVKSARDAGHSFLHDAGSRFEPATNPASSVRSAMTVSEWSKSEIDYGRKLVHSGLEGARAGREAFLHGEPLAPVLDKSVRDAAVFAAAGTGAGLLGSILGGRRPSAGRVLAFSIFGGAIGFGMGLAWRNRRLEMSVVSAAWKNMGKARDEHWLEKNPIDYA
jgi:hypothetical protein